MRIVFNARIALQRKIAWLLLFSFFSLCFIGGLIYFNKKNTETMANMDQRLLAGRMATAMDKLGAGADSATLASLKLMLGKMMQEDKDLLVRQRTLSKAAEAKNLWLLIGASVMIFLFISIILIRLNHDIVLRRRAEQRLTESQSWLQSILDNSTSLIYIKDPAGRYVMVNRRFREILAVQEETVIGHTDADFSTVEAAEHYQFLDEQVISTGKSLEIETVVPTAGGEVHLLSIKFPLMDDGRLIGIGGIATDITERVQYQQQLIAATREAQSAKGMQELFLANMSHEIRTPMNGIQGMTDLLLDTSLTDQQKEFARIIKRSVNNLLVVVNDVLDFSKIKAGKLAIEKIEFRLKDVIDNVRAMFAHRIAKKGLRLLVDTDPEIPETLKGDPYRLNQVLINLIGNAIKFTEKGWIRIQVTAQERTAAQVKLVFSVADSGIGIPEASLPHIFDHFSQAGLDISRKYGGTGLGLAICHQLLQLQGGEITVHSQENEGSVFYFSLAYGFKGQAEAGSPVATAVLSDHFHSQCLAGKRFLVAEDNEVNQQLIDHVLRKGGGEVRLAVNGEEAVDCLRQGESYDLVIMDLQMPVMDGYAATRYIRQELRMSIPIIAMTATALVDEQLRCLEAGMNDYMTKPFEFAELYKRINSLIFQ